MTYIEMVNRWLDLLEQPRATTLASATGWTAKGKWLVAEAMRDIVEMRLWRWREKEWVLQTVAPYSTGTITIAAGTLTTVTGSGTSWSSSNVTAGLAKIRPGTEDNYYLISAVGSTTSLTLTDSADAAVAAGTTYKIFQDVYNLGSDVHAIRSLRQFADPLFITTGEDVIVDEYIPDPQSENAPRYALFFSRSSTGLVQVRFYPIPSTKATVRLKGWRTFSDMSVDADTPGDGVIPASYHQLIVWKAFMDACTSGIADDVIMAARIEKSLGIQLGQRIMIDAPDQGKVIQMGEYHSWPRVVPFRQMFKHPVA